MTSIVLPEQSTKGDVDHATGVTKLDPALATGDLGERDGRGRSQIEHPHPDAAEKALSREIAGMTEQQRHRDRRRSGLDFRANALRLSSEMPGLGPGSAHPLGDRFDCRCA